MIARDVDRERRLHQEAVEIVNRALADDGEHGPGLNVKELGELLGNEAALELESRRFHAMYDLRGVRDEMRRVGDSIVRDVGNACRYARGESASFNSLGALQGAGPRFDSLCALFPVRHEIAVERTIDVLRAIEDAS